MTIADAMDIAATICFFNELPSEMIIDASVLRDDDECRTAEKAMPPLA